MSFTDLFSNVPLVWFIIGLAFVLIELVVPGFVLIFFGFGAWLVAALGVFVEVNLSIQIVLFVLASVLSLVFFRKKLKARFFQEGHKNSASLDEEFLGKEVQVIKDITPEMAGKVEFKGTQWRAKSASEIKAGKMAVIVAKESISLIVQPLNN